MTHPKNLSISEYNYELPDERIAKHPLATRDSSKLLVYNNGTITESNYQHLTNFLPENSLLVFNNTKVVEARLLFTKPSGGAIELFCLEPWEASGDITQAMLQKQQVQWKCLVGGAKKWKLGPLSKTIQYEGGSFELRANKTQALTDCYLIDFWWSDASLCFAEVLHAAGVLPLPPYLHRTATADDAERYQTIYARNDGSVAAPTAGLHFTDAVFEQMYNKKINICYVTLHVGAGTFKPVKSATMETHEMHSEYIQVPIAAIKQLAAQLPKPIVGVGTTSLRTIETLYWMGVKLLCLGENYSQVSIGKLAIQQWDAYELPQHYTTKEALLALADWLEANGQLELITSTQIIIAPPYQLKVAEGIVTNFHQPQSTLLLLVAAIIGKDWQSVYQYALANGFRFLSYGDGSLLWKTTAES